MKWGYIIAGLIGGIVIGVAAYFLLKALKEKSGATATSVVSTLPEVEIEELKKYEEELKKKGMIVSTIA